MEQPLRFVAQEEIGKGCRLRKSLYGLKQVLVRGFVNSTNSLRNLACRSVNLTIPSSTRTQIHVLFCW